MRTGAVVDRLVNHTHDALHLRMWYTFVINESALHLVQLPEIANNFHQSKRM